MEYREHTLSLHPNVASYVVFQVERAPETGRLHLQGYVEFVGRRTLQAAKTCLTGEPHLERRRGTAAEASAYCKKPDSRVEGPWEVGAPVEQGERRDLEVCKDLIRSGAPEVQIADEHFDAWCRHYRAFARYRLLLYSRLPERPPPVVAVFQGPSGCGKSRLAREEAGAGGEPYYFLSRNGAGRGAPVYWDGYDGEKHVVIDEYYGWIPFTFLLRLLDRYPVAVNQRGSQVGFSATHIWFTSNHPYHTWYPNISPEHTVALQRRISRVVTWDPPTPQPLAAYTINDT